MAQVGRISGGLLEANLLRNGIDLRFADTSADISSSTPLLHLDVTNNKININSETSTDVLNIPTTLSTTNAIGTVANIANITIDNSAITSNSGNLNLNAGSTIFATALATSGIKIDFNTISSRTTDQNIELRPDGNGNVNIRSNLNSTGAIHATGDITFGGNFVIGNDDTDDLVFAGEIISDIIPDAHDTYDLGSDEKRWNELRTQSFNTENTNVENFIVGESTMNRRQGNIFYVSTLGDDTNVGDHQHGAFRTIKHALEVADASSLGPIAIHIFPGIYEEVCPLVVPERITILGHDIRNTIITPTVATNTQDIFQIQGNVTVENLTIKDFFSPGHAFSFVPNGLVNERSPYIRNITVITQGSTTSASDPRGYLTADAGKGALIDGSILDFDSLEASMLFHSCTFITPGVDAITMTNGVRVEWLNCFTYFANRGLYATRGNVGNANPDSSMRYGAEVRSIGSASVYGNIGAEADGADALMYLIGHNFAYIGVNGNVTNDDTLHQQANEVIQINDGVIHFVSTDQKGTFRVGDTFFADYDTGITNIDANSLDFTGIAQLTVNDGTSLTVIKGDQIDTANIRISGNTITTTSGELEFAPNTQLLNLQNSHFKLSNGSDFDRNEIEGDIRYNTDSNLFEAYSTGNLSLGGVYSDDRQTYIDATPTSNKLVMYANSLLAAEVDNTGIINLAGLSSGDVLFDDALITTTLSNSDLDLIPNGTGILQIDDIEISDQYIKNLSNNALTIDPAGTGWVKFDSTNGIRIPTGTNSNKYSSPELGHTRYNSEQENMEVYNGTSWQPVAGDGGGVDEDAINELLDLYVLVLG